MNTRLLEHLSTDELDKYYSKFAIKNGNKRIPLTTNYRDNKLISKNLYTNTWSSLADDSGQYWLMERRTDELTLFAAYIDGMLDFPFKTRGVNLKQKTVIDIFKYSGICSNQELDDISHLNSNTITKFLYDRYSLVRLYKTWMNRITYMNSDSCGSILRKEFEEMIYSFKKMKNEKDIIVYRGLSLTDMPVSAFAKAKTVAQLINNNNLSDSKQFVCTSIDATIARKYGR